MATHSWTYDAPAGVFKNHAMSADIRFAAIAQTKFVQFTNAAGGLGKNKGESVTITRVSNLAVPSDDSLVELEVIPEDEFALSTQSITVTERGRAVPYSSLDKDLSALDIENAIQKKLRDQLALRMDKLAADAFKRGRLKVVADGATSLNVATNGTAGAQASVNLNMYHVETIRDLMFSTYNIAPYMDGDYVALASTKACRGIKRDTNWEKWHQYTDNEAKFKGEIGRIEGVRFIEINNTASLNNAIGAAGVCGEAVFFGDDPVAMATVIDPELRAKESGDYGRSKGVAWYGIYGFDQIWYDSANPGEARVIHLTST